MNSLIVEKTIVNLREGERTECYAVATDEPHNDIAAWSLTFEAYLTPWSSDRAGVEALQRKIEKGTP